MDKNKAIIIHMISEIVLTELEASMFRVSWEKNWLNFYLIWIDYKDWIPKNYI